MTVCKIDEPQRQKTVLRTCTPIEDLDQPTHSRSLIRICSCAFAIVKDARLNADKYADLSLRWKHMAEGTFSHVVAYMFKTSSNLFLFL